MARTMKRGDLYPPLTGTATDADGAVPLGPADSVKLLLRSTSVLVECPVTIVDPDAVRGDVDCGKWTYDLQDGDTDTPGTYAAELEVTWPDGNVQTFPNAAANNETVTIDEDLNPS